jgi:hypothetical protein
MNLKTRKDLTDYKRRYNLFRHHAWAGLGFLSVLLAVRILFPELLELLQPILVFLIVYVLIALIFTYKYRAGLFSKQEMVHHSNEFEKEKIHVDIEKERLKLEKKKTKSKIKAEKKLRKK